MTFFHFSIIGRNYNSNEEVDYKEAAKDHEEEEEKGQVRGLLVAWD
jgi:hypothetical protein